MYRTGFAGRGTFVGSPMESFEQVVLALEVAAWRVSGAEQEYSLPKAKVIHIECGHQMDG